MKKLFCCPALELFHCLPLWKTELFVSSRAFSLSTPTFLLSTPVENSAATWKKATKCKKLLILGGFFQNNVGCQNKHLSRVKTKQNGMKKAKYLS
jgi:hypothetical protein